MSLKSLNEDLRKEEEKYDKLMKQAGIIRAKYDNLKSDDKSRSKLPEMHDKAIVLANKTIDEREKINNKINKMIR
jgi:hypothetical protein